MNQQEKSVYDKFIISLNLTNLPFIMFSIFQEW